MDQKRSAPFLHLIRKENEKMAEEENKKVKAGNLGNLKPIKSYKDCKTEEERQRVHEISVKGGLARGKQMQERKSMQEVARELLYTRLSKEQAKEILGTATELIESETPTLMEALTMRIMQEGALGNCRAYELIRDTAGFSPKQELSIEADVTTDADRELMQNVLKRLG